MGARVYLTSTGRFLQVDPIEGGTPNAYSYVLDPVNYADYNGMFSIKKWFNGLPNWGKALVVAVAVVVVVVVAVVACVLLCAEIAAAVTGSSLYATAAGIASSAGALIAKGGRAIASAGGKVVSVFKGWSSTPTTTQIAPHASEADEAATKTFQTYTKFNPTTGEVYAGKTSGFGSAEANVAARDLSHHMTAKGFGPAVLDKSSLSSAAIRGREQMLIDKFGGAQSMGGTAGNAINGISPRNANLQYYMESALNEFGGF